MAEGGTSQDMERKPPSERHSHPGNSGGRGKSGHGKKVTGQGALTAWRQWRGEQVRTQKEKYEKSQNEI